MTCFKMKQIKLQFCFCISRIFIMQHPNTKNKKMYGTELRLPAGYLTNEQIKQGSRISDPADEQHLFCLLHINKAKIPQLRESAITHLHFGSPLHSTRYIHQSVKPSHPLTSVHAHHPLPNQGFLRY